MTSIRWERLDPQGSGEGLPVRLSSHFLFSFSAHDHFLDENYVVQNNMLIGLK